MRGRRAGAPAAVVAAVALLSSCGTEGDAMELGARVQAEVEVGGPFDTEAYRPDTVGLRVEYTLTNDGDDPLLVVLERGHEQGGFQSGPDVPEAVWVSGVGDGVARLSKQMFDASHDSPPTDPWTAPVQRLGPGESLDGQMFVLLPIHERLPEQGTFLSHDEAPLDYRPDRVEVCVQVAPVSEDFPDATMMTGITQGRTLVCAEPVDIPDHDRSET